MQQFTILWSDSALNALKNVYDFAVVTNNISYAKKLTKQLYDLSLTLTLLPSRNPIEPLLQNEPVEYRFILLKHYKIIYFIENEEVIIAYIFDTRKDTARLIKGD